MIGHRLSDPGKICKPNELDKLQAKVEACITQLFRQPKNGGNPFLFAFLAKRPHEVHDKLHGGEFKTAATNGTKYYWNPEFLGKLTVFETQVVLAHEAFHNIFHHCSRMKGCNHKIANIALDYVVNAVIEVDHDKAGRPGQLWGPNLGDPITFKTLLDYIDGGDEIPKEQKIYADKSLHGRSPESIYDEIMKHWENSPRKCKKCKALSLDPKTGKSTISQPWGPNDCPDCGAHPDPSGQGGGDGDGLPSPMDSHIDSELSKQEVMTDVMRAARQSSSMKGSVPAEVEDLLGELIRPTLKFTDIIRNAMMRKVQDAGIKNDWKRFRRRYIAAKPRQYLPKRHTHHPRWIAMLDTSGSMSDDDITYGISQLQSLGNSTEGYIIPCDASPKWNNVTPVKNVNDLKRTKIVGRGGTVFDQFFKELPEQLGTDFDAVIIITDGHCGQVPKELAPPTNVVWVITRSDHKDFTQPFGRTAPLRVESL